MPFGSLGGCEQSWLEENPTRKRSNQEASDAQALKADLFFRAGQVPIQLLNMMTDTLFLVSLRR